MADKQALIVEDTLNWIKRHRLSLSELGFDCAVAHTYAEAIGLLRRQHFDIAVIDLCLTTQAEPENLNGVFLLPYFVEKGVPVIVVTGRGVRRLVDAMYKDFDVFEVLDKLHFDPQKFKEYVMQAVAPPPSATHNSGRHKPISRERLEEFLLEITHSSPLPHRKPSLRSRSETHLSSGQPRRIFLSHSSQDKPLADRLVHDLRREGYAVWYDSDDIHVGDTIFEKIEQGLAKCDDMIVILSPAAVQSWMVRQELIFFHNEERRRGHNVILPLLYQDCEIPRWLEVRHYADFRQDYAAGFTALQNSLASALPPAQKP
ncbi:MAG: hypothetical protein DKINENOH_00585 [bacterium]|nr:hypothetical protein [bacterium]